MTDVYQKKDLFFHLHIPKCGGCTITDYLKRSFRSQYYNVDSRYNNYQYNCLQVLELINGNKDIVCYGGHKFSLDLPWDNQSLFLRAFTWIREPAERFISHYFFHRFHTDWVPEAKKYNLKDYTKWALIDGNQPNYINGQLMHLSQQKNLGEVSDCVEKSRLYLFDLKQLDLSVNGLNLIFPGYLHGRIQKTKNVSKKDQIVDNDLKELIQSQMLLDFKLYDMSQQFTMSFLNSLKDLSLSQGVTQKDMFKGSIYMSLNILQRGLSKAMSKL